MDLQSKSPGEDATGIGLRPDGVLLVSVGTIWVFSPVSSATS